MKNGNKIFIVLMLFFVMVTGVNAQDGQVVIQPDIVNGLRVPVLTTAERNQINPTNYKFSRGQVIFNIDTNCTEFWNGTRWVSLCDDVTNEEWFHCPSSVIPTSTTDPNASYNATTQVFTFDIYDWYAKNMSLTITSANASSPLTPAQVTAGNVAAISVYAKEKLIYLVTYYDNTVFSNVTISADGKLSYKVIAGAVPTAKTYMNIIFKPINI
jgi:hypothetical protein